MGSVFTTPTGRYVAQVNRGGTRRSKTFDKKSEADRWIRVEEGRVEQRGAVSRDPRLTDILEAYVSALEDGKAGTGKSRAVSLRMVNERLGRKKLSQLDVEAWRGFAMERAASGAGPATVMMDLSFVGSALRHGAPLMNADASIALAALGSARRILSVTCIVGKPLERDRLLSDEELQRMFDFWDQRRRAIPMQEIVLFLASTAMRLSEVTRITWDDYDAAARTVLIRSRKHPSEKDRNDQVIPLLRGHFRFKGEIIDPVALIEDRRKFRRGEAEIWPFDSATISTSFTRAVAACGIEDARLHDLRHVGVTNLFRAGLSLVEVARVSGHRDLHSLKRYEGNQARHRACDGLADRGL